MLATRDFNLIPAKLHPALQAGGEQDGLSAGGAPPGLSDPDQPHSSTITRGHMPGRACCPRRSVVAAPALRWSTRSARC